MNAVAKIAEKSLFMFLAHPDPNLESELNFSLIECYLNQLYFVLFVPFRVKWNATKRCYQFSGNILQKVCKSLQILLNLRLSNSCSKYECRYFVE